MRIIVKFSIGDTSPSSTLEPPPMTGPRGVIRLYCQCIAGLWSIGTMLSGADGR